MYNNFLRLNKNIKLHNSQNLKKKRLKKILHWFSNSPSTEGLKMTPAAVEHSVLMWINMS